jgi:tetratricopeptide (TPR) repeat protein
MKRGLGILALGTAALAWPAGVAAQASATAEKLGTVHFDTSCAPETAASFDRAVALLHSFEFPAAIAGFEEVQKKDPACGMAVWGVAMSTWGNPFGGLRSPRVLQEGLAAATRAQAIGAQTSREREYIQAVSRLYEDGATTDQRSRTLAYQEAMQRISSKYPDDLEAAAFYALAIAQNASPTDKTFANQLEAANILERLYGIEPNHPGVTHYLIHCYDVPPLAARALPYARRYADLAPDAPHALHMPSHTFTRLGLWQESIETNVRSHDAALKRGDAGEALHAMDYMLYAYLQTAQDTRAQELIAELTQMLAKQPAAGGPGLAGAFPAVAMPARFAIERNRWSAAINLQPRPASQPYIEAMTYFARAMGGVRLERLDILKASLDQLAMLRDKEIVAKDLYWTTQVEIQRQEVEAWQLWVQGGRNQALESMRKAAALEDTTEKSVVTPGPLAPAHELLGDMLMDAKRPADALNEYETVLQKEPNRFRSVYGAGHAAELAGFAQKARAYYQQLVTICTRGERQLRPELAHAASYVGGTR